MTEFIAFAANHWILSTLFLFILALLIVTELRKSTGIQQVSPQQAVDLFNHHQAVILDIRSREAYEQGHVIGAEHFDIASLDTKKVKKFQKKIVIVVADGASSAEAVCKKLHEQEIQLRLMEGGISGWVSAGLPLTKK